jgi:hypothetical protein
MSSDVVVLESGGVLVPQTIAAARHKAARRYVEFFTLISTTPRRGGPIISPEQILSVVREAGLTSETVEPVDVATFVEQSSRE